MRFLALIPVLMLAASTAGAPASSEERITITKDFFRATYVKYTSQHDIVNLVVPLNKLNFEDDDESGEENKVRFFFVEADVNSKGEKDYKGLFLYKDENATKLLDNGRYAAAFNDDSKKVYLGATDGIYVYDGQDGKVNKVGLITDNVIQVEADNQTGFIYYLTESHELFSLNDEGVRVKIDSVKNAQEFAIDFASNIFFYDDKKELYVFNQDGVQKITGVTTPSAVKLVRPMFAVDEGVFGIIGDDLYLLHSNATAEKTLVTFQVKPTAYAPEATLLQYYAYEKKIYEFNILAFIAENLFGFDEILKDKKNEIENIATKPRRAFGA